MREKRKLLTMAKLILLTVLLSCIVHRPAFADSKKGTISINLKDLGTQRQGVSFGAYKVGDWDGTKAEWKLTDSVADLGITFADLKFASDWDEAAKKLSTHSALSSMSYTEDMTDADGNLTFADLDWGIYLVTQNGECDYGIVSPFLITLPSIQDGAQNSNQRVIPKAELPKKEESSTSTENDNTDRDDAATTTETTSTETTTEATSTETTTETTSTEAATTEVTEPTETETTEPTETASTENYTEKTENKKKDTVRTGDDSPVEIYMAVSLLSLALLIGIGVYRRGHKKRNKLWVLLVVLLAMEASMVHAGTVMEVQAKPSASYYSEEGSSTEGEAESTTTYREEATTEQGAEATTENKTEATTEQGAEATTEKKTEATTEQGAEATTENKTEATTEQSAEVATEATTAISDAKLEKQDKWKAQKLTAKGEGYVIEVEVPAKAQIPEGATLQVIELPSISQQYDRYVKQASQKLNKKVVSARFFDIAILFNGEKVEPKAAISVLISYDSFQVEKNQEMKQVHFAADNSMEVLEASANMDGENLHAVSFAQNTFSVSGTVILEELLQDAASEEETELTILKSRNDAPKGGNIARLPNTGGMGTMPLKAAGLGLLMVAIIGSIVFDCWKKDSLEKGRK